MIPTWAAVVGVLSLVVIAASAVAVVVVVHGIRSFVTGLKNSTLPMMTDVREMVAGIRTEVDGIVDTSRDIRHRLVNVADGAEARLADIAAAVRTVQAGVALWKTVRPDSESDSDPRPKPKRRKR
jgi:uncharacterized protein YoxC